MKKPISKTPRTDRQHILNFGPNLYVKIGFARQLERQLNASNKRIKRLEREVELLRLYGNKDCITQADEALKKEAKP